MGQWQRIILLGTALLFVVLVLLAIIIFPAQAQSNDDIPFVWSAFALKAGDNLYHPIVTAQPYIWLKLYEWRQILPGFPTATEAINWVTEEIGKILGFDIIPIPTPTG